MNVLKTSQSDSPEEPGIYQSCATQFLSLVTQDNFFAMNRMEQRELLMKAISSYCGCFAILWRAGHASWEAELRPSLICDQKIFAVDVHQDLMCVLTQSALALSLRRQLALKMANAAVTVLTRPDIWDVEQWQTNVKSHVCWSSVSVMDWLMAVRSTVPNGWTEIFMLWHRASKNDYENARSAVDITLNHVGLFLPQSKTDKTALIESELGNRHKSV